MSTYGYRPVSPAAGMISMEPKPTSPHSHSGSSSRTSPILTEKAFPGIVRRIPGSPTLKKCRICFQTDLLTCSTKLAAKGKEPRQGSFLSFWRRKDKDVTSETTGRDEDDGFISPCACRGSMKWVHRQCLEEWRHKSARRDSFYSCEYCFEPYRFRYTWMATVIRHPIVVWVLTAGMVIATFMSTAFLVESVLPSRAMWEDLPDGLFGIDGGFMPMPPSRSRWTTKTLDHRRARERKIFVEVEITKVPEKELPQTTKTSAIVNITHNTEATETPKVMIHKTNDEPTGTENAHSTISYFNIAYWLTGHSFDDREERRNDFLLAIMDISTVKLYAWCFVLLCVMALIRDCSLFSMGVSTILVTITITLEWTRWSGLPMIWLFPMPAAYGAWRFVAWQHEAIESVLDLAIKNFSSELENYSDKYEG